MPYATAQAFQQALGASETCQLLQDEESLLTEDMLQQAINGELPPSDTSAEADAARAAVARLEGEIDNASRFMDGYFRRAVTLPLSQEQLDTLPCGKCCVELTRCALMDDTDNSTEHAQKRCEEWRTWLRDIAYGRVALVTSGNVGRVIMGKLPSEYNWKAYP